MKHIKPLLLFLSLAISLSWGELALSLSSYGQLTTSSGVGWLEVRRLTGEKVVRSGDAGVCRQSRGVQVEPGSYQAGVCTLLDGRELEDNFHVLVDLYGLARLEWRHWDMFSEVSVGSVSYQAESYVATTTLNSSLMVGDMRPARGLSGEITVWAGNQTVTSTEGQLLLELRPLRYQIEEVRLGSETRLGTEEVRLANISLTNESEEVREVSREVSISWNSTKYWGRVGGMVRGLQTLVMGEHCVWGITSQLTTTDRLTVSRQVEARSVTNLTISIILVRTSTAYTGLLTAVYRDGQTSRHNISAVREQTRLDTVSVSPQSSDSVIVSTINTTTTTTTTTITTTTTTATTKRNRKERKSSGRLKKFKKSLHSANLIQPRMGSSKQERSYTVNPLRIFYPVTDDVKIDKFTKEKNKSNHSSSTNLNLLIIFLCSTLM